MSILIHLACYKKRPCAGGQAFISHSDKGWKFSLVGFWGEPSSWLVSDHHLTVCSRGLSSAGVYGIRENSPFSSRPPVLLSYNPTLKTWLNLYYSLEDLSSDLVILGLGLQHEFWRDPIDQHAPAKHGDTEWNEP